MTIGNDHSTAIQKTEPAESTNRGERYISPFVDVFETENEYVLLSDIPGVSKSGLKIRVENDELVIDGRIEDPFEPKGQLIYSEIQHENYHRVFRLANNIDRNKIEANLNQGVLKVILPKEEDFSAREIQIKFDDEIQGGKS